jgi:hypothetical protein
MNCRRTRDLADLIDVDDRRAPTDFYERSDRRTTSTVAQSNAFTDANSRDADMM